MTESSTENEEIFHAARDIPEPARRRQYVRAACDGDAARIADVEALLAAADALDSLLDSPDPFGVATIDQPANERTGTMIGPYKLIEQIGEGGMGAVWMAQQQEPVKRLVAVKLIKAGMDSKQIIARFEAERQALALMDHANIARVLDAGTTAAGRPYFVMDLVRGVSIIRHCDEHHLTPRQRLELFIPICQAVQHAHQKGIIHRDLKPSNVLVAVHDGKPVPKVIDFGVAKATGQSLTDKTLVTGLGNIVGTLEYMSPEQAETDQLDIDTRSDIYSLGALLYELLAGSPPFSRKELEKAGALEMLRVIREREPSKPSTKLSTAEGLPTLAANRGTEPAKLTRLVRGELDWIVMKALEKDRNRRYETANGFAMDVQRYLADEPVQACPPSVGYRFRKFTRRNRAALITVSVIGVAILLAVGCLGWMVRDRDARRVRTAGEVNQFLERAGSLYAEGKLPEALAEVEKARGVLESGDGDEDLGRRVRQWLTDIKTVERFEELRRQHPDITDWDRVDAGYLRVFREYGIDPDALSVEEAAARVAKSQIMFELTVALDTWAWRLQIAPVDRNPPRWHRLRKIQRTADPDPFRQRLHRAADRPGPNALPELRAMAAEADVARLQPRTLALLGGKLVECGDPEAGVAFLRIAQRQHPGNFLLNDVLGSRLTQLKSPPWNEVIEYRRVALALHPNSASAHSALGTALQQAGRVAEAHEALREAVRLAPDDVYQHERFGWVLLSQKKFSETEAAFREVIRLKPDRAAGHHGLGRALLGQSKFSEGIASLREAVRLGSKDHWVYDALGWALVRQGEFAEAEAAFREFVRRKPELVHGYFGLGRALVEQEKFADAEAALREALRIAPTRPEVPDLLARARAGQGKGSEAERLKKLQLGKVLREQKKLNEAVDAYREAVRLDPSDPRGHELLGWTLFESKHFAEAEVAFREAVRLKPDSAAGHFGLGRALQEQKKLVEAVEPLREAIRLDPSDHHAHESMGWIHMSDGEFAKAELAFREVVRLQPRIAIGHFGLGQALVAQQKFEDAEQALREALRIEPDHKWARQGLSRALAGQGKRAEADAILKEKPEQKP